MKVKKLHDLALVPTKGSEKAAGYDLYSSDSDNITIKAGERGLIKTGISIAVPTKHYGRIAPRSGLALKSGINVLAGVIDEDYRGEVGVLLHNTDKENDVVIKYGDRIAQLIVESVSHPVIEIVEDLEDTVRAAGGFGSTGS